MALLLLAFSSCGVSSEVNRTIGARCDTRDECEDRCLQPSEYPGGFCTLSCEGGSDCPSDSDCVDREGGVCLFRCLAPEDCAFLGNGWTCGSELLRSDSTTEVMVCVPS